MKFEQAAEHACWPHLNKCSVHLVWVAALLGAATFACGPTRGASVVGAQVVAAECPVAAQLGGFCAPADEPCPVRASFCAAPCLPQFAYSTTTSTCEADSSGATCKDGLMLVRKGASLRCVQSTPYPAELACAQGSIAVRGGCATVLTGTTLDIARYADAVWQNESTAAHAQFCSIFRRQRLDTDLLADRASTAQVQITAPGNSLAQLRVDVATSDGEDRLAYERTFVIYTEMLQKYARTATLQQHTFAVRCAVTRAVTPKPRDAAAAATTASARPRE
jgi:hypothetical protein